MSGFDKPIITRWWWIRHAPVRDDGGNIYGQKDIACDTSHRAVFEAVARILPRKAVWFASSLKRTHQTAEAIWAAGFPKPAEMMKEVDFAEQNLGRWQGMNRAMFLARRPVGSSWFADVSEPAPDGESFIDLYNRVCRTIERINIEQAGRDVIAVGHGGTIKAALGVALGGEPEKGLAFDIDNCSVTRLDHFAKQGTVNQGTENQGTENQGTENQGTNSGHWRLPMVNQQPWIADAAHKAMDQPAGSEVAKLA